MIKVQIATTPFNQVTYYKTGNGPALFLIHGFPANYLLWRNLIPVLEQRFTLILPNFFEHENDWLTTEGLTSTSLLADAFFEIMQHENLDSISIIGHSMGGYMGLSFAQQYPKNLIGISLCHSSVHPDDTSRSESRKKTISILEKGGKLPFLKKMVPALFSNTYNENNKDIVNQQYLEAINVNDQSLVAFYKAITHRPDFSMVAEKNSSVFQHIIGEKDSLANLTVELSQSSHSFVTFVNIMRNDAHMGMLENPALFNQYIIAFLKYCYPNYT
jgi:pimeloyl-ACP methyl ester carboxylesterase